LMWLDLVLKGDDQKPGKLARFCYAPAAWDYCLVSVVTDISPRWGVVLWRKNGGFWLKL